MNYRQQELVKAGAALLALVALSFMGGWAVRHHEWLLLAFLAAAAAVTGWVGYDSARYVWDVLERPWYQKPRDYLDDSPLAAWTKGA